MTTRIQNIRSFTTSWTAGHLIFTRAIFSRMGSERPSRPHMSHQTSESADGPTDIKVPRILGTGTVSSCRICLSALDFSYLQKKERGLQDLQHCMEASSPRKSRIPQSLQKTVGDGGSARGSLWGSEWSPVSPPTVTAWPVLGSAEVRAWQARPAALTEVYQGRLGCCLHRPGAGACLALARASHCSANWNSPNFPPN